ncbi:hypothetical protein LUZ60_002911 [Juncus effusus]|nr:hypothetical protein LUZ60_002911 [Juncus effusus]
MMELLESTLVAPADSTPHHRIWLSNLDLTQSSGGSPLVFFYRPNSDPSFFSPDKLKSSLSQVLVSFYPLAGRVVADPGGRPELNCSGKGVPFVTARVDFSLSDLKDFVPSPEMRRFFGPQSVLINEPLIVQITYLKCGGAVLGVAVHHAATDGRFFYDFLQTWSNFTNGTINFTSLQVNIDRTILKARSPPIILSYNAEYTDFPFVSNKISEPFTTAILPLDENQLNNLRTRLSKGATSGTRFSTFQAVVSHVWRCICIARDLPPNEEVQLAFAVDFRNLMVPPLPKFYFGNAVTRIRVNSTVAKLMSDPIKHGAEKIKVAINQVDDEYVRSLVDYLETIEVQNLSRRSCLPKTKICVISWLGLPVCDVDFGWGKPVFMSRAQMYGTGFVYLIRRSEAEGGINVIVSLEVDCMDRFKQLFYEQTMRSAI